MEWLKANKLVVIGVIVVLAVAANFLGFIG